MPASTLPKFNPRREFDERERQRVRVELTVTRGTCTLDANQTTTQVSDAAVMSSDLVFLQPTSANASSEDHWISATAAGSFTITHASDAATDRTFNYHVLRA